LEDLTGYKVYYGASPGEYSEVVDVGNVTSYTASKLPPGSHYFAVTAYNSVGDESEYSDEVSKTVLP